LEGFQYAKLHLAIGYAQKAFSVKQYQRAEFWTNRAFGTDPRNIEAIRLMAEINEVQDHPAALGWRIRLAQREPENAENIMAWAKSAIRFDQVEMALKALNSLPSEFKGRSAEYYELMAGCVSSTHYGSLAEGYFRKAAELDPGNPVRQINLASFRLMNSPDPNICSAAKLELEGKLSDSRVALYAVRSLLEDARRNKDRERVQRFAGKLRSIPGHNLSDDLACLDSAMSEPDFHHELEAVEDRAKSDAIEAAEVEEWLNARGMASESLRWFARLQGSIQSNTRAQMSTADSYLVLYDWSGLKDFLAKCNWGGGEFLKRAMLSRCNREIGEPWEKDWKQLVTETNANPPESLLLARLVTGWNWSNEAIELLWGASARSETASDALKCLWDFYYRTGNTLELLRVSKAQLELEPSNPLRKNNEAFLALLLNGGSARSERLASEASAANPNVPEWAATYAYALHLAGKEIEAAKVMKALPPLAFSRPGVALYYAIVLAATGENARAKELLTNLNPAGMLPEERKLAADLDEQLQVAK